MRSQVGFRGRIKLLSGEGHLPYDRIVISKGLNPSPMLLRNAAFYAENDVEVGTVVRQRTAHATLASAACLLVFGVTAGVTQHARGQR